MYKEENEQVKKQLLNALKENVNNLEDEAKYKINEYFKGIDLEGLDVFDWSAEEINSFYDNQYIRDNILSIKREYEGSIGNLQAKIQKVLDELSYYVATFDELKKYCNLQDFNNRLDSLGFEKKVDDIVYKSAFFEFDGNVNKVSSINSSLPCDMYSALNRDSLIDGLNKDSIMIQKRIENYTKIDKSGEQSSKNYVVGQYGSGLGGEEDSEFDVFGKLNKYGCCGDSVNGSQSGSDENTGSDQDGFNIFN